MAYNVDAVDPSPRDDVVDFATSPSNTSCDCTCTFTKILVTRFLASASHVLTIPAINTGRARPSDALNVSDIISKFNGRTFTLKELQVATYNFSNKFLVGKGGFGYVYKGLVPDGSLVAIKRFAASSGLVLEQLQVEIELTSRIRHQNLVPVIGLCLSKKPKENILVYPFKVNGDLYSRIGKHKSKPPLDWLTRKKILLGAARGLSCLHNNRIIHSDIKPANILLDENLEACIGDLGTANDLNKIDQVIFSSEVQNQAVPGSAGEREMATSYSSYEYIKNSRVIGTYRYIAPEYSMHGICSVKIDVFSFGVTILDVVTGRKVSYSEHIENGKDITPVSWIKSGLKENKMYNIIDPDLLDNCDEDDVKKIVQLGLACMLSFPEKRPSMVQVVQALEGTYLKDIGIDTDYIMMTEQEAEHLMMTELEHEQDSVAKILPEELSGPR